MRAFPNLSVDQSKLTMAKRFISGAVCPRCGAQDVIRAERDEALGVMVRECVDCGYTDQLLDNGQTKAADELPTRVSAPEPVKLDSSTRVLNIVNDPGLKRKDH